MKILGRLRKRRSLDEPSHPGSAQASSTDERRLPLARYDLLDGKQVIPQLSGGRSDPPTPNGDGPPAMRTEGHRSRLERLDPAREERNERERLHEEARYSRERLELYRARLYGGRAVSQGKLRELQRASDGAAARLCRAEAAQTEEPGSA
jgi:hypothetical protein